MHRVNGIPQPAAIRIVTTTTYLALRNEAIQNAK